jgi:hypothetical protein
LALQSQGKLEQFRRVWFADEPLRLLTRGYKRKSKELTAELNRMWKVLRLASPDLFEWKSLSTEGFGAALS